MKLALPLITLALTATGASAQTTAQRTKPRTPKPRVAPAEAPASVPRTFAMKNGMRATLIHSGAERKVAIALVLTTGEIDEPAFGPGLASLTAHMLLQGTVSRSAQRIGAECAELGTKLSVQAGPMTTSVSGDVDAVRIPRFLSLIADLVRHPLLDTAGFGRVQRDAVRSLDSTLHNPDDLARQQWRAIIFPDGPFGHPYGFPATIGMLKLGHVRNVYDDNYSASRAHLYVSGGFDDAATEKAIRETFGDWPAGMAEKPVDVHPATVHEVVTVDLPGAEQSVTWIGLPTIDPADHDFAKLEVADMILAGSDSSRVAADLSAIEGSPEPGGSSLWERRNATYWVDVLHVRTEHTGAALGAVIGELSSLRRTSPGAAEVARAKARVVAAFDARNNSRDGLVSLLELMDEHSLGDGWRNEYDARVMAVTPDDVRSIAATYLDPARMAIAVVGDKAAIEPQLDKLRPVVP